MIKTIEQRAIEAKDKEVSERKVAPMGDYWFTQGYIQGARDQRKIDIDKAWKWIEWMLGTQSATPDFVEESRIRFEKAMEE